MSPEIPTNLCYTAGHQHHIKLACAVDLISNFISQKTDFAQTVGLGGVLHSNELELVNISSANPPVVGSGMKIFMCLDKSPSPSTVFVATRYATYDRTNPGDYLLANSDRVLLSSGTFTYTRELFSVDEVLVFINQENHMIAPSNALRPFSDARDFIDNFRAEFTADNLHPYGVITEGEEADLLGQPAPDSNPIVGIRWFLGYDNSESHQNRIRMIFFAVLQDGRSLLHVTNSLDDAVIIEKTWPDFV